MAGIIEQDASSPGSPGRGQDNAPEGASERSLDPAGTGWLLEEPRERRIVSFLWSRWDQWEDERSRWHAQWKANRWRRGGLTGVVLQRPTTDDRTWGVYAPPGSARLAPTHNLAARLCRQLKANVWADAPVPEAIPGQADDDDAENAAEFSGRWLRSVDSSPPVHLLTHMKRAFDVASTYDSGFLLLDIDPQGGGHRFVEVEASPAATEVVPIAGAPGGETTATHRPILDPETGALLMLEPLPEPFVKRYLAKDGRTLTDDPSQAQIEWLPSFRPVVLTPYQVRPTTKEAVDVETAEGILVARYQLLGELRKKYPAIKELTFPELRRLVDFEPEEPLQFLPHGVRSVRKLTSDDLRNRYGRFVEEGELPMGGNGMGGAAVSVTGMLREAAAEEGLGEPDTADDDRDPNDIPDDVHVWTLCLYQRRSGGYAWGAEVCIAGDQKNGRVLYRGELAGQQEGRKEALPLPVAQSKQFEEGLLDFYGVGAMTLLGLGNEARASFVASMVEHLDRFNRRKVFYDPSSLFQPRQAAAGMGTYIPVAAGTEPKFEQVPEYPRAGVEMLQFVSTEMQDDLGLAPVAQGKTDPSVKSALHAATIVEQVVVNLSDVRQATEAFILSCWRIMLAYGWARFDKQQTLQFFGDDQSYKAEDWLGSDIGTTRDVRLAKSSFTMLAPSAKLQVAEYAYGLGIIDSDELRRIFGSGYGADIGVQDNPALLRVRRQINEFWKGPPPDFVPAQPVLDELGQPVVDPVTGQPQMQPPSHNPFPRIPADLEPATMTPVTAPSESQGIMGKQAGVPPAPLGGNAMLRMKELGRASCSARFERLMAKSPQHQAWGQMLLQEYEAMRQAAGVMLVAELQAQMQAAQQAEQEAMQQQAELEGQGREEEIAAERERAALELEREGQGLELERARGEQELEQRAARGALDLEIQQRRAAIAERQARARTNGNGRR